MTVASIMRVPWPAGCSLLTLALFGCRGDTERSTRAPAPSAAMSDSSPSSIPPAAPSPLQSATVVEPPLPAASHPYIHGVWSSCTDGFSTSDQPQRDVTRLSYLCGPYQGMRRLGRTWFGRVDEDGPKSFEVHLLEGQCGRVFATASSALPSFVVRVSEPSGSLVARGHATKSYTVANREGAFCVHQTGSFRVEVEAKRGAGLVAAEVWTLPAP